MVCAPLALAIIHRSKHRIIATGWEDGMPNGTMQIGRSALAHLGLPGRLARFMPLGIDACQGHQLIRIGETVDVPDFRRDGGAVAGPNPGTVRRYGFNAA
jgi:hypothetical protein